MKTWADYVGFAMAMVVIAGVFVCYVAAICDRRRNRKPLGRE